MPDPDLCEFCQANPPEPGVPCCDNSRCKADYQAQQEEP